MTRLIQELGLHDDEDEGAESSDYSHIEDNEEPQTIPDNADEDPDNVPQDF